MRTHRVERGDCLSSLAAESGLASCRALYEHPSNGELRKRRDNPNVLAPGDEVVLPEPVRKSEPARLEARNRFVMKVPQVKLRVYVRRWDGTPYADKRFVVDVGPAKIEGRTNGDGLVEASISAVARSARLRVWFVEGDDVAAHFDRKLAVGALEPIETIAGLQARLANLAHACPVSGVLDEATLAAARRFRARADLPTVPLPTDGDAADETDAEAARAKRQADYVAALLDEQFRSALRKHHEGT